MDDHKELTENFGAINHPVFSLNFFTVWITSFMSVWPFSIVETYCMDLVSKQINSLLRLNDDSLQGFEWFRWNYSFVGTAKLYDSTKCACTGNIMCHSYLNLNVPSVSLAIFF